jgi:hypothetical protein
VEPDLYRLVLGAANTLWADDADLEFGYRGNRALGQRDSKAIDEFGKDNHAPGSVASLNVGARTCANAGAARASIGTSSPAPAARLLS